MHPRIASFAQRMQQEGKQLYRFAIDTVQINVGKLCNQACLHCHVEAGPKRTEIMDRHTAELTLDFIRAAAPQTVDITGGAPELNPSFRWLVEQNRGDGRHVIDRCNLTILFESGQEDLPQFLADRRVEIVASLPCYSEGNVTKQRGQGVYDKSIEALRRLNRVGYGKDDSGLVLNLVYNPVGTHLPPPQATLEIDYKRELGNNFGITFNHLYTITNMPIARFAHALQRDNKAEVYMELLASAFNPATLDGLMCRHQVSISWDGYLYDCDFNQMLDMKVGGGKPFRLGEKPSPELVRLLAQRAILVDSHCYGCTAGAGSSCGGTLQ
jgi:radical SAM/Cys-rich protein